MTVLEEIREAWGEADRRGLSFPCLVERFGDEGEWQDFPNPMGQQDPYGLIDSARAWYAFHDDEDRDTAYRPDSLVLFVEGWASPLNDDGTVDGAPSAHPERRRVRLGVGLRSDGSTANRLCFIDEAGEVAEVIEESDSTATGSLADALDLLGLSVWGRRFTQGLLRSFAEDRDGHSPEMVKALAYRVARLRNALGDFDEAEGDEA